MLDDLPFLNNTAKVIVADLSLHYFSWEKTKLIVQEISRVLVDSGYLLCRVNSVNDKNHGAGEGIPIEKNYYNLNGKLKRFFDTISLKELFSGWEITYLVETKLHRFEKKKVLWELSVRKNKVTNWAV
jgi:ubiquinone/menaquinone biosynthesis C-methylase UbiE